ncbi:hypothetical protein [Desulfogranum japonicum]|uniref:hypothetical protein n=1 Tax=Desulfogranum japonicum TaxID=231447 RepID=UPI00040493C6|nr:hypothetical protein [Desulfogranum japonicum]
MINIQTGDVFCVRGGMETTSAIIRFIERVWSKDNGATYGHSGIIRDSSGNTLESLWVVKEGNLEQYVGQQIVIYRPVNDLNGCQIDPETIAKAYVDLRTEYLGRWYAIPRQILHLLPPLARLFSSDHRFICSELVAKFLCLINARYKPYIGVTPDRLADEWHRRKNYQKVFEGVWRAWPTEELKM